MVLVHNIARLKPRRVYARLSIERSRANTRVVCEGRQPRTAARVARLGERVLDESAVRLLGIGYSEARLRNDLQAERREQRLELAELPGIGGGEHEFFHASILTGGDVPSPPRMRRGGGRRPPGWSSNHELPRNDYENSFKILDDFTVLESDHPDSGALKESRADGIAVLCSFMVMSRAVQLHGEPFSGTIEVQNIGPDAVLTPEFPAPQTPAFEMAPQARFRGCESSAKFPAARFQSRDIVNKSHTR